MSSGLAVELQVLSKRADQFQVAAVDLAESGFWLRIASLHSHLLSSKPYRPCRGSRGLRMDLLTSQKSWCGLLLGPWTFL